MASWDSAVGYRGNPCTEKLPSPVLCQTEEIKKGRSMRPVIPKFPAPILHCPHRWSVYKLRCCIDLLPTTWASPGFRREIIPRLFASAPTHFLVLVTLSSFPKRRMQVNS